MPPAWRRFHPLSTLWAVLLLAACAGSGPPPAAAPAAPPVTYSVGRAPDGSPLPPVARVAPETTALHGHTLVDPYPWLRRRDDPEVRSYLEAENRYTEAMMASTEGLQEELYGEILGRIRETDLSAPYLLDGFYYYTRTEEGRQYPIYCRKRGSLEAAEEVLLDVNELAAGESYLQIADVEVSPDGRLLAFLYDTDGSERFTLRVKDLTSGELLPDRVTGASWQLAWGNDNRTLFYLTTDATHRPDKLFRHRLGADPAGDELVYQELDEAFYMSIDKSRSQRYLLLGLYSITTGEVRFLDADRPGGDFTLLAPRRQGVEYTVDHHGRHFYVRTNDGATHFKLMRAPVDDLAPERWQEVLPHRPEATLTGVDLFAGHLVVYERRGGLLRIRIRDLASGEEQEVGFPEEVYAVWPGRNPEFDSRLLRFRYTSLVTPPSIFDYDMAEGTRELKKQTEVLGGYDPSLYTTERTFATAPDGTPVPISLVYRAGLARDGSSPCLLYGYGAYGYSMEPTFSAARLSLLDRGFVYAIAHVRGGGEMGESWREAGKLLAKKNSFTDFIAAAEHLVAAGYTAPERLAIMGGSAGGLLVGAVVNQRPELFAAAVAQVPFVDLVNTMLDPTLPLTVTEREEWGDPREPAAFEYMLSYSPYDNLASREYPALLVTAGLNDPRVSYWEPAKWVARLRATVTNHREILLKTRMGAGHGGASGRYDALREVAFEYAFLLRALGVEG